ncbi:MAG: ABC transporter ATP-binding protein [bacterium]
MIRTTDLTKHFGSVRAVEDLNLSVSKGELFGFLGPNGAGKTTTIKMLTGLLRPTSGQVVLGGDENHPGYDMAAEPEKAKAMTGYVPDQPFLYEKLSGYEFIHFVAGLYNVPPRQADEKIDQYFALFGLSDAAHYLIESYSHGMRQKVVMTAALVHDPAVLILDEQMVGLDPRSARLLKDLLKQKSREGMTIFLSTHTLDIAEELCNRIGIIQRGHLIALGTMDELRTLARDDDLKDRLEAIFLKLTQEEEIEQTIQSDRHIH